MSNLKNFVGYSKETEDLVRMKKSKEKSKTKAFDPTVAVDLPAEATINVSSFSGFVQSTLAGLSDKGAASGWLARLKAHAIVKNQAEFLKVVKEFQDNLTSVVQSQVAQTKAQAELLDAQREKEVAEAKLEHVEDFKDIEKLQLTDEKLGIEVNIEEKKQRLQQLRSPKLPPGPPERPEEQTEQEKREERHKAESDEMAIKRKQANLEEERIEQEWRALCDTKSPPWPHFLNDPGLAKLSKNQRVDWNQQYQKKEAYKAKIRDRIFGEE